MDNPEGNLFSPLALIIREALNQRRSFANGDIHIARIIRGCNAMTGLPHDEDLDHTDPIRLDNFYSRALKKQFPINQLTSCLGLTNLLVWMSTGQGYATQEFCSRTNLWFTSLESCIQTFRDAVCAQNGPKCYNQEILGTTCISFAVESALFTIEDKFTPLFSDHIINAWRDFLGIFYESQADETPRLNQLPSFTNALKMVDDLMKKVKLNGFKSGLTRLQFANNLVSLG